MKVIRSFAIAFFATSFVLIGCKSPKSDDPLPPATTKNPNVNQEQSNPSGTTNPNASQETKTGDTGTTTPGSQQAGGAGSTTPGSQQSGVDVVVPSSSGFGVGPYRTFTGDGLIAVDFGDPTQKLYTITTKAVRGMRNSTRTKMSSDKKNIEGINTIYVVFVADDHLWRTDIRAGSNLSMTQISSAAMTNACTGALGDIELNVLEPTDSTPESSYVYWYTGGTDNKCETADDNQWYRAQLSDRSTTAPTMTTNPEKGNLEYELGDPQNISAGITEIITVEGNTLKSYDKNHANPTTIATATTSLSIWSELSSWLIPPTGAGVYIQFDDNVRWYARGSGELSLPRLNVNFDHEIGDYLRDASDIYFSVTNSANRYISIYRLRLDGSGEAQLVAENVGIDGNVPGTSGYHSLRMNTITENYIFITSYDPNSTNFMTEANVYRVAKTGGARTLVVTGFGSISNNTDVMPIDATRVMIEYEDDKRVEHVSIFKEDGTKLNQFDNARAFGLQFGFSRSNEASFVGIEKAAVITNSSSERAGTQGAKLQVYDAKTETLGGIVGQLPTKSFGMFVESESKLIFPVYVTVPSQTLPSTQIDIFYIDLTSENSLRRLTDTPDKSEKVYW